MINKMQELMNDQEFGTKVQSAESIQDVISAMKECGVEATEEDVVAVLMEKTTGEENEELGEDLLDSVAGGGRLWDWIKKRLNEWFKNQSKKNTDDLNDLLAGL